jgi:PKHD-type hydroxylase
MRARLAMRFEGEANSRIGIAYNSSSGNRPFSAAECDAVIRWLEDRAAWDRTALEEDIPGFGKCARRCNVVRLDPAASDRVIDWLPRKLSGIAETLNRELWHFDITGLSELHLLRYDEGDQVTLHADLAEDYCERKIAILTQLSPPDDYQGGALEYGIAPAAIASRERGSVLAFPAWVPHRVAPITGGKRYALSCFALGPSFR